MHHYKWNIGDYSSRTAHLNLLEDIAYRRMIDLYHMTESPLSVETQTVSRLIRMSEHCELVERILNEFFFLKKDGWHQQRCDTDIEEYRNRSKINKEVGKLGGRPKKTQTVISENPDGYEKKPNRNPNQEPITSNQEPVFPPIATPASGGRKKKVSYEDDENFTYFWDQYRMPEGREKGSKKKAFTEWRNLNLNDQEYAFYMLDLYLAETNKNEGGRYRKQVYLYLKDRLWEQFDVPESIRKKMTNNGGEA